MKIKFVVIFLLILILGCTNYIKLYGEPLLAKGCYDVKFQFVVLDQKEFRKEVIKIFGNHPECTGFTIMQGKEKIVVVPRNNKDFIDLETLGHEIYFHVIKDEKH